MTNSIFTQIGSDIDGEAAGDNSGSSVSLSSDGRVVAIGAPSNSDKWGGSGHVRIYQNISGTWTQVGADIDGERANDKSGLSVSLSDDGSIVAIGAPNNDGNGEGRGHVRIYQNVSGTWTQVGSDIDGEAVADSSGGSVSLSSDGSVVAIGAYLNEGMGANDNILNSFGNIGHVRIYKNVNNDWVKVGADIDGEAALDYSGYSVSLSDDGSVVAIGAIYNDGNGTDSGHVRIYKNINNIWTQVGADIDGEAAGDRSGWSVSLSSDGSVVAIGAPNNDGNGSNSGHVRIYRNINNTWTQIGSDIDGGEYGLSGGSVSLSSDGSVVAIGAELGSWDGAASGGHVRIYRNINNTWTQIGSDIDGEAAGDQSGKSVSLSEDGSIVAIGAFVNDGNGRDSGHVRIYNFDATDITAPIVDSGDASFSIVGIKSVGNYLSIKTDSQDPDGTGELSYQWQSSSDGSTWSNVSTNSTYRLQYIDSDKYYRASISYTDDDGFNEIITTDTIQVDKHSIHTSLDSLNSQLSNLSYSTSYDYTSLGYSEEFGTSNGETLYASANEIVWGLGGNDSLRNSYSTSDQYLIGGSGNDTYTISGTATAIIYEAPNQGTNDTLYLSSNYLYSGYAASIDNKHLVAINNNQAIFVLDGWENTGIENIYLGSTDYTSTYFLSLLPSLPGYLGNISWDELKPYAGDLIIDTVKTVIDGIKSDTITVESDFENLQSSLKIQIAALEAQAADLNSVLTDDLTDLEVYNYIASNNDLISAFGIDIEAAKSHYIDYGISEGRSLTTFSSNNYLAKYSDLSAAFGNNETLALKHYIQHGYSEGRTDSPTGSGSAGSSNLTDLEALNYIASYGDLINAFGTDTEAAKTHFIKYGKAEGRAPDTFNAWGYLVKYDDLVNAFGSDVNSAIQHYINHGYSEGRSSGDFEVFNYIASHDDLINAFGSNSDLAGAHYLNHGKSEGRSVDTFDEWGYLASNNDLMKVFGSDTTEAIKHYISFGNSEGRSFSIFDAQSYLNNYSDLRNAFGNDHTLATKHYVENGFKEGRVF